MSTVVSVLAPSPAREPLAAEGGSAEALARLFQEARPLMEALVLRVSDGVTVQAADYSLCLANPAAARMLGAASPEELLRTGGAALLARYELLDGRGAPVGPEVLPGRLALAGQVVPEFLLRFRDKHTGAERWSQVSAAPVREASGRVAYAVNVFRDVTESARTQETLSLLAEAGALLSASLEVEPTLEALARLLVPRVADGCTVDLVEGDTGPRRVAIVHRDPAKVALARELRERYPMDPAAEGGIPRVLRTGVPELVPDITDEILEAFARDAEHLRLLRALGLRSSLVVPLVGRGRTLGTLGLFTAESGRRLGMEELRLVQELARRAALAVDNARLFEETRRAQARLELALDAGRMGTWDWDIRAGRVTWSAALERLHGLAPGRFPGSYEGWRQGIHSEDRERVVDTVTRVLAERQPEHHVQHRIVRADGEVRWVEAHGRLLLDEEGQPVRLTGVCMDITERLLLEADARRLEGERLARQRTADILASITDPLMVLDGEWRIQLCNARAAEAVRATPEALLGRGFWEAFPEAVGTRFEHECHRARREGVKVTFEEHYVPLDRWFEVSAYPMRDGLSLYFRDVTDRRRTEAELDRRARELARSNAELEQFAYVASHDLQEPLRMVASYVQLLQRRYGGKLDGDADRFIGFAVEGANRMHALINDLLAFSRVGTRGRELAPVSMAECMERTRATLHVALEEAGAEVVCEPLPRVMGDEGQLLQLLQNLVGNAVKFRGERPLRVRVSAVREGDTVTFSVEDNGIGIDPRYFERIFVIFQRLHTRERYPGNGIGLSICKKIVERHGGRIWVESVPGEGTVFRFTLAAADPEGAPS